MGCNATYNLGFAKNLIQISYPDLIKNNYIKIIFKLKPTNGGCFQRPMVDPGCLNPPVQKGCNVHFTPVSWNSTASCATRLQLRVHCTLPDLLCSSALMTKQAQHTLLSAALLQQKKAKASLNALKWSQMAWLVAKYHLKSIPFRQWEQPRPLRSCFVLQSAPACRLNCRWVIFLSKYSKTLTKFKAEFFQQLTLVP